MSIIVIILFLISPVSKGQGVIKLLNYEQVRSSMYENEVFAKFYEENDSIMMGKGISMLDEFRTKYNNEFHYRVEEMTKEEKKPIRAKYENDVKLIENYEIEMIEILKMYETKFDQYSNQIVKKVLSDHQVNGDYKYIFEENMVIYATPESFITEEIIEIIKRRDKKEVEMAAKLFLVKLKK